MPVRFSDLLDALEFASAGSPGENQAFLDRRSGEFHYHSDMLGDDDELNRLPADIEGERYLEIPHKKALGLDSRVALDFAGEHMPSHSDEVRDIFSRRGAYRRFRSLVERTRMLDRWYDFSNQAEAAALRAWCAECELEVSD